MPAMWGDDWLVPLSRRSLPPRSWSDESWFESEATERSEAIRWPGAEMSGFVLPSRVGPSELKQATRPRPSVNGEAHQDVKDCAYPVTSTQLIFVV